MQKGSPRPKRNEYGNGDAAVTVFKCARSRKASSYLQSRLKQWPCKLSLVPTSAPYLDGARLLLAADCCAYAHSSFHDSFMKGRFTLIGCPATEGEVALSRLTEIISKNDIENITLVRMDAGCCDAFEGWLLEALKRANKTIPISVLKISTDGKKLD